MMPHSHMLPIGVLGSRDYAFLGLYGCSWPPQGGLVQWATGRLLVAGRLPVPMPSV